MSDSLENLRRKIDGATELESVVRTMKALAESSNVQYERAVRSLDDYYHTVADPGGMVAPAPHQRDRCGDPCRRQGVLVEIETQCRQGNGLSVPQPSQVWCNP